MPEWSLGALRLMESYLDLVARAARERGLDSTLCVARVRRALTAAAERDSRGLVRLGQLLRAMEKQAIGHQPWSRFTGISNQNSAHLPGSESAPTWPWCNATSRAQV
jgi:hypothetical protein